MIPSHFWRILFRCVRAAAAGDAMDDKKTSVFYKILKFFVLLFYPKIRVEGAEKLPEGPAVVVGNHSQLHGPIASELYFPGKHWIWCAGQMMELKEVAAYAYEDFWSFKPRRSRWYYKLCAHLIAPLSVCIFNNAHTIPVYRDSRLLSTFRETVARLQEGAKVIVFPEHNVRYSNILYEFEQNFVDTARFYYKKTGQELSFVPMYMAPKLKTLYLGEPVRFNAQAPIQEERQRICQAMAEGITRLACSLPEHTVVPYRNIPKRLYPKNIPYEVYAHEQSAP